MSAPYRDARERAERNLELMRTDPDSDWHLRLIDRLQGAEDVTEPELMALKCASRGLTVGETAVVLNKATETIRSQLRKARVKLGAKTTCVERSHHGWMDSVRTCRYNRPRPPGLVRPKTPGCVSSSRSRSATTSSSTR